METATQLLIVEDEPEIRRFLRVSLSSTGYDVREATRGEEALKMLKDKLPDLVVLDLGLPDIDGLDIAKNVRDWSQVPIIVLSARDEEGDKVAALDAGADDYLIKPFSVPELLARIRVALRHHAAAGKESGDPTFKFGDIHVDLSSRVVYRNGQEVHLTPTEYKLLLTLIKSAGRVVTQQQLLREVWGPGYAKEGHYLRIYMANLRHKLEDDPARPQYLITEPGIGCRIRCVG